MPHWIPIAFAVALALRASLQTYWALGGQWLLGAAVITTYDATGPKLVTMNAIQRIEVMVLFPSLAFAALLRTNIIDSSFSNGHFLTGVFVFAFVNFLLRMVGDFKTMGLFKKVTGTRFAFWDSFLLTPLYLALCLISLLLALT